MDLSHLPLLIVLVLACALAGLILALSHLLGPRRPTAIKSSPFECGNPVKSAPLDRFHVKFYLVAILFLAFDIEAVFVYPWAVLFGERVRAGQSAEAGTLAACMVSFSAVLLVGLGYAWRKGALRWEKETQTDG